MGSNNMPPHIKADMQKLAYDRTCENINRICDTFDMNSDCLAVVASSSMSAAFMMLYCSARLKYGPQVTPNQLFKIWGETQQKEFDHMIKGFDVAQDMVRNADAT